MTTWNTILVIGKNPKIQDFLRPRCHQLFAVDDIREMTEVLSTLEPDCIIVDEHIPHISLCDFLRQRQGVGSSVPILVLRNADSPGQQEELDRFGAVCCLDIEFADRFERLSRPAIPVLTTANSRDPKYFSEECPPCATIVGRSPSMLKTLKMIRLVARSTCNPVLIVGETGTGKELAARAVHVLRHGSDKRFVALNCAALTATLLESELFGHVKGAFTSADRDKTGLLELAEDGTIFLDEISEMPLDLQAKLLRVVQERNFRKVGGTKDIPCRATIISSSNRNLHKTVEESKFRRDLYYRLAICPIVLAPLRADSRRDDILLLADYFIQTSTICPEKAGRIKGLTKLAQEALLKHSWPGNVRELKNVIERAILFETGDRIGSTNLILHHDMFDDVAGDPPIINMTDFSLEKAEKELVKRALQQVNWQKTRAAALLGITRATLYAKVRQHNIPDPSVSSENASAEEPTLPILSA
ncbi:MAG: sigma-54-dependent Fis family transcriptional regulator [Phycisphaerae bacterium]|nr:sigma-54-dependent Fis family transcriptional regulator [Phycisphaerae bacterium]